MYLFLFIVTRKQKRSRDEGVEPSTMHELLMKVDSTNFKNPSELLWLPFPMLGDYPIPERFTADKGQFSCLGREIFPKLEAKVQDFLSHGTTQTIESSPKTHNAHQVLRRMLIYGNTGTGKSHLLMMLGMSLRKQFQAETPTNRRIVIVPSAFNLVTYKMDYLLAAVRLACAADKRDLAELEDINDPKDLGRFCGGDIRYIFIVDQADYLEVVKEDEYARIVATLAKEARDMLTYVVGHRNFIIYGSSANNDTAKQRFKKQQDIVFYDIFGGFSKIEMENWLKYLCKVNLSADQKDQLLVDTGGVLLFLTWFWPQRNCNLVDYSDDDVNFAVQRSKFLSHRSFIAAIAAVDNWVKTSINITGFEELASAFLMESVLPSGFSYHSYNNRYPHKKKKTYQFNLINTNILLCGE